MSARRQLPPEMAGFPARLRAAAAAKGYGKARPGKKNPLSFASLAHKVGISPSTLHKAMDEKRRSGGIGISAEVAVQLARELDVSIGQLLCGEEDQVSAAALHLAGFGEDALRVVDIARALTIGMAAIANEKQHEGERPTTPPPGPKHRGHKH